MKSMMGSISNMEIKLDKDITFKYKLFCEKIIIKDYIIRDAYKYYYIEFKNINGSLQMETFSFSYEYQIVNEYNNYYVNLIESVLFSTKNKYEEIDAIEITNKTLLNLLLSPDIVKLQLFFNLYKNISN